MEDLLYVKDDCKPTFIVTNAKEIEEEIWKVVYKHMASFENVLNHISDATNASKLWMKLGDQFA